MAENDKITYQSIKLFDLNVFSGSKEELLNLLTNHLRSKKSLLTVMTPNPEQVVLSRKDNTFLDHLQSADVLLPDGVGLIASAQILDKSDKKHHLKERISGRDVAAFLLAFAQKNEQTVMVIGGRGYGAGNDPTHLAGMVEQQPYSQAFWLEGYKNVQNPTDAEEKAVEAAVQKIKPEIVLVAFGAPWQEKWLVEHRELLESVGVRVAIVVGGALDVLLGKLPAAPAWMEAVGLEWLFRLIQEPWRWRRQLKLFEFIKLTFQSI